MFALTVSCEPGRRYTRAMHCPECNDRYLVATYDHRSPACRNGLTPHTHHVCTRCGHTWLTATEPDPSDAEITEAFINYVLRLVVGNAERNPDAQLDT
jgi:transposase-like protein